LRRHSGDLSFIVLAESRNIENYFIATFFSFRERKEVPQRRDEIPACLQRRLSQWRAGNACDEPQVAQAVNFST
jgi:hypothetical protein